MIPLAHYWGLHEVGIFVIPAVAAIVLLRWVERKARARREREEEIERAGIDD